MRPSPENPLLVRADAAPEIGTGHVMRCLALAQAWQDAGGRVVFLMASGGEGVAEIVRQHGIEVRIVASPRTTADDADETARLALSVRAAWTVLDGYDFSSVYRCRLSSRIRSVLWVDDLGTSDPVCARLLLNTEIIAARSMYPQAVQSETTFLLGPDYFLIRRDFLEARARRSDLVSKVRHVLVTLGGADPENVTPLVLQAIAQASLDAEVTVVVGPANPRLDEVRSQAQQIGDRVHIITGADMPELMAKADLAVSAGGVTSRELAFMGVPQIVMALASNQAGNVRGLTAAGAAVESEVRGTGGVARLADAIQSLAADFSLRRRLSEAGSRLIDGHGANRVVEAILADSHANSSGPAAGIAG